MSGLRHLPAYKSTMGVGENAVNYFQVQMSGGELLDIVKLATEVNTYTNTSKTLSEKLQRSVNENRAKRNIAKYLALTEERFMPSFVVAVFDSNPKFRNIKLDPSDRMTSVMIDDGFDSSFGILSLKGDGKYFVLDGQHRLAAMRFLDNKEYTNTRFQTKEPTAVDWDPQGLRDDQLSVLFIANEEAEDGSGVIDEEKFRAQARKIFTVINRHAKPTSLEDNIMMDENDIAAIVTRDLIEKHDKAQGVFYWDGKNDEEKKVNTDKSNLTANSPYLTTLSALYNMNKEFISTLFGWEEDEITFCFTKTDQEIEDVKNTISIIWDEMINTFTFWKNNDPSTMKNHTPPEEKEKDDKTVDHLLFWPVGQIALSKYLAKEFRKTADNTRSTGFLLEKDIKNVLKKLDKIDWNLFSAPWKGIVLNQQPVGLDPRGVKPPTSFKWSMPSSGKAHNTIQKYLAFLTGTEFETLESTDTLRADWDGSIILWRPQQKELNKLWEETLKHREKVSGIKHKA